MGGVHISHSVTCFCIEEVRSTVRRHAAPMVALLVSESAKGGFGEERQVFTRYQTRPFKIGGHGMGQGTI